MLRMPVRARTQETVFTGLKHSFRQQYLALVAVFTIRCLSTVFWRLQM